MIHGNTSHHSGSPCNGQIDMLDKRVMELSMQYHMCCTQPRAQTPDLPRYDEMSLFTGREREQLSRAQEASRARRSLKGTMPSLRK